MSGVTVGSVQRKQETYLHVSSHTTLITGSRPQKLFITNGSLRKIQSLLSSKLILPPASLVITLVSKTNKFICSVFHNLQPGQIPYPRRVTQEERAAPPLNPLQSATSRPASGKPGPTGGQGPGSGPIGGYSGAHGVGVGGTQYGVGMSANSNVTVPQTRQASLDGPVGGTRKRSRLQ
jgi:hypothetical protein